MHQVVDVFGVGRGAGNEARRGSCTDRRARQGHRLAARQLTQKVGVGRRQRRRLRW